MGKKAARLVTARALESIDSEQDHLAVAVASIARESNLVLSADYWRERIL
jgi:hypothetical protein